MKSFSFAVVLRTLCRDARRPGAYVSISNAADCDMDIDELQRAAPWFDPVRDGQLFIDLSGFLLFDDAEEMERVYRQTVGEDGPTAANPYRGPVRVYVLTCSAAGRLLTENT